MRHSPKDGTPRLIHVSADKSDLGLVNLKEGLINSRYTKNSVSERSSTGTQLEIRRFGSIVLGCHPLSDFQEPRPHTPPLDSRQQPPSCHVQICQPAADLEPVGVLRQPTVSDLGPAEDPLDHQERMLHFGPHFRLRAVSRPLGLTQWSMPMGFRVNEATWP